MTVSHEQRAVKLVKTILLDPTILQLLPLVSMLLAIQPSRASQPLCVCKLLLELLRVPSLFHSPQRELQVSTTS